MPNTPPASITSRAESSARAAAVPPPRFTGICPISLKNHAVRFCSKYSALATNVTLRFNTSGKKNESDTLR